MEPAAMLVRALEIQRRRPMQIVAVLQYEAVRRTGIEPDVEDIGHLLVRVGVAAFAQETGRLAGEPRIRAFFLERIDNPFVDVFVEENFSGVFFHENRDRHAPGALARDHPVRALLDHAVQPVAAARRVKRRLVYRLQRFAAQAFRALLVAHGNEPLRRVAEDQRRFRPPGMRILVLKPAARGQCTAFDQQIDDARIGVAFLAVLVVDPLTGKQRDIVVILAPLADGMRHFGQPDLGKQRAVLYEGVVIVRAVPRRRMHEAGARFVGNVIARQHRYIVVPESVATGQAAQGMRATFDPCRVDVAQTVPGFDAGGFLDALRQHIGQDEPLAGLRPIVVGRRGNLVDPVLDAGRIDDRPVRGNRPGRRCPDQHRRAIKPIVVRSDDRELDPDRRRNMIFVFDLGLGQRGALDD